MPKKREVPAGFDCAVKRYLAMECSTSDIAKEFVCAKATVLSWMKSLDVPRHDQRVMASIKLKGKRSRLGAKHTAESKQKMSAARAGQATTLGFKFSQESREKMRKSALHRIATTDSYQRMRAGLLKIKLPDDERVAREKARDACKRMLRRILTMARVRKDGRRSELLLGYTKEQLRSHIESQFKPGMNWSARDSFHIDHIKPVAQFFREGVYDPAIINALCNLQVLTPAENRKKGDRHVALIIDSTGTRAFA